MIYIYIYIYICIYIYIYIYIHTDVYVYINIVLKTGAQTWQKQDGHNIYAIMKTMCPPGHHQNGFVATQATGHMIYVMYTDILHCI